MTKRNRRSDLDRIRDHAGRRFLPQARFIEIQFLVPGLPPPAQKLVVDRLDAQSMATWRLNTRPPNMQVGAITEHRDLGMMKWPKDIEKARHAEVESRAVSKDIQRRMAKNAAEQDKTRLSKSSETKT